MSDNQTVIDLDYEAMHKQLVKEKRDYKGQLNAVILSSTGLEFAVNQLVEIGVKKVQSPLLKERLKGAYVPISSKLRLLRFANLVNENLYKDLTILFKVRNRFAHELFLTSKDSATEFEILKDAHITNKFLKALPNDSKKFQLIVSKCFAELVEICNKLDPSSVLKGEIVGDIVEVHEYE